MTANRDGGPPQRLRITAGQAIGVGSGRLCRRRVSRQDGREGEVRACEFGDWDEWLGERDMARDRCGMEEEEGRRRVGEPRSRQKENGQVGQIT